jgi:hypothetical protein
MHQQSIGSQPSSKGFAQDQSQKPSSTSRCPSTKWWGYRAMDDFGERHKALSAEHEKPDNASGKW